MRSLRRVFLIWLVALLPLVAAAQVKLYYPDTTVKVYAYGQEQTLAWCGGFNNPQFSMGDLNHDGLPDLVTFEPWKGVSTFINEGTVGNPNYRYAPEFALNFPPIYDYLVLADYNCDGVPDLFHQGNTGISVYKGYYNAHNQLCFTFYRDLYYYNDLNTHGPANAFNNPGDIPSIVDVDGDGDLDFISYNINGGYMELYRNLRVELGLPCDSIHIALKDNCWGKVYQGFYRTHQLAQQCDNSSLQRNGERVTHSGNTPCLFDWDMDGDYDYLDGSVSFNEMTFLKNGRIPNNPDGVDSMVEQDTVWQAGGAQIQIPIWPAAYNVDIDQDGKKDLLIAPNGGASSINYNNIWFYKNYSTPGVADWRFQSDSFLADRTIDLGTAAYPALYDYNKDGRPDLFIGSDGYRQSNGLLRSRISYYLNMGTAGSPAFTLQTNDFMGLGITGFAGMAPAMGDIDGDGIDDMVVGHTDGSVSYYKNLAAGNTTQPVWQLAQLQLADMNGSVINVNDHAAPFIYDVDRDGKQDLVIGEGAGYLQYYRNVSTTPGNIRLQLINTRLGGVKADPVRNTGNYSAPFFGRIDSTGVDYLLVGSGSGNIYKYTGFQSGDTTATYTLVDAQYSFIDSINNAYAHIGSSFPGVYDDLRSAPVAGDVKGDGGYEMIVGDVLGGARLYRWKYPDAVGVQSGPVIGEVNIYPNPVSDVLNVSWSGPSDVQISIMDMAGRPWYAAPAMGDHAAIAVNMLPVGVYVCVVTGSGERWYGKFVVVR